MVKRFLVFAALAVTAVLAHAATMEDEVRAVFDKYIAVQNAHDLKAMRSLLADSPDYCGSAGQPIWVGGGPQELEERYKALGASTRQERTSNHLVSRRVAQVYAPTQLTVGDPGVDPPRPGSTSTS